MFDELLLVALAEVGVHSDAEPGGQWCDGLPGALALAVVVGAGGIDRGGAGQSRPELVGGRVEQVGQAVGPLPADPVNELSSLPCASMPSLDPSGFSPCRMIMTTVPTGTPAGSAVVVGCWFAGCALGAHPASVTAASASTMILMTAHIDFTPAGRHR
jgi:hypothetical protein